jgi:hypothetical protein
VYSHFDNAYEPKVFVDKNKEYTLMMRPLLPHETVDSIQEYLGTGDTIDLPDSSNPLTCSK